MAQLLKTNVDLEEAGVWCEYPNVPGIEFRIGRIGTPAYKRAVRDEGRKYLSEYPGGDFPEEIGQRITDSAMARVVLLGWRGLDGDDGAPVEYTFEQALYYMTEPGHHDVATFVYSRGSSAAAYQLNGEAKN